MFEAGKIKRILSQFSKTDQNQQREMTERLVLFGEMIVPHVANDLRYDKILYADALHIFKRLYKNEYLKTFVNGLGDNKENVRLLFKEILIKSGKKSIVPQLIEYLADDDHMVRKLISEIIKEMAEPSMAERVIPLIKHQNREVKKVAMDVLCSLKSAKATQAILPLLDDPDSWIRRKAVEAVCRLKDKSTVDKLLETLSAERDPGIQKIIIGALGECGEPQNAEDLLPSLKSQDMVLRQQAIDSINKIGDSSLIPKLMEYFSDEDVNVRRASVEILNGLKDPQSAAVLVKALKDGDWWVREVATEALSELGGSKISQMIMSLLDDKDEGVRRSAVEFFCKVKEPTAYDKLVLLLDDKDWWVREKVIAALGLIGDKRAIPEILQLIDDREVKAVIPKALCQIGGEGIEKHIAKLLSDRQKHVRAEALRAMATIDNQEAIVYLKEMVKDSDEDIQGLALIKLREKTGRIWLKDEVLAELDKAPSGAGPIVSRAPDVKTGDVLTEAIMVVDIVSSTDIASKYGDNLAFQLSADLSEIIKPISEKEGVQFYKSTGDGFLMTFVNVEDAVKVASQTLARTIERNKNTDKKRQLDLRFAINVGETRVDVNGDRLGAAINMAFRVEGVKTDQAIPAPGGIKPGDIPQENRICITEQALQEISESSDVNSRLLGFFELKGFTGLHRIFEITL
ncbi:hypothetical protein MNBD_NITROSPINAE04-600 [hydrothermal vent metagenome]|uniref:Guanylate cyclase domain-containing protein n=1 Tax=hydrothermal vent metagenome TaxID=652676 RepID=A0A3B1BWY1_9ZZZZ